VGGLLGRVTLKRSLGQIRHVDPVWPDAARGLVARVYGQLEREFGMLAPPVALHSPAPTVLAACWLMLRETLLAAGRVDRPTKEAIAAAVSLRNACPYCVDVHSATLNGLLPGRDAAAIAAGRVDAVAAPELRAIAAWARGDGEAPPFPAGQAAELVGVAVAFHYLNRMVNVFLGDSPIPAGAPAVIRRGAWRAFGRVMRPYARRDREPGYALDLLPPVPPPDDLSWTAGSPFVAEAMARSYAAIDEAGESAVPAAVRGLVAVRLARWDGGPTGLGRAWVDEAVAGLPAGERAAGRLALLAAFASYQIDQSVIDGFRRDRPDDAALIRLTGWASLAAARRIGVAMWSTPAPVPPGAG